jgi:diguanylate cyclase (GGDEF)-like protein/PAS domain S-box-containing protein
MVGHSSLDSNALLSAVMDSLGDSIAVLDVDGLIIAANQAWRAAMGSGLATTGDGRHPTDNYYEVVRRCLIAAASSEWEALCAGVKEVSLGIAPQFDFEFGCGVGPAKRWFAVRATPLGAGCDGAVVAHRDVSEHKSDVEKLQLAASVFLHAHEGILITNQDGEIVGVNERFCSLSGYTQDELIGKNPRILNSGRQDRSFYSAMWHDLRTKGHWTGEVWNRNKAGEIYAVVQTITAVHNAAGVVEHYIALGSDITSTKDHKRQLEHVIHYDVLTKLPNRVLLSDRIRQMLAHARRSNDTVAVLCMDLDDFKVVNDTYGVQVGDQILVQAAGRMLTAVRIEDTVARLGGDEFVLLMGGMASRTSCEQTIRRLLEDMAAPYALDSGERAMTSASIGYTLFPEDDADPDTLIRHADQAMFAAKQAGKNRSHRFDLSIDNRHRANWSALAKIERGLERGEFQLYIQPKVLLATGQVQGAEALIRWLHPLRGLIPPSQFLPLLEGQALMNKLGNWVLREGLTLLEQWNAMGIHLPLSVNVDAMQLRDVEFAAQLGQLLAAVPTVLANQLEIEIVESAALDDVQKVSTLIDECHVFGVHFSLDDFGTGYSSLTYLKRLSVDTLKIDQTFVRDMLSDDSAMAIVRGVIGLAEAFHSHTVAEGVETWEHAAKLKALGCETIQGYAIARPMPATQFPTWLAQFSMPDL